MTDTLWIFTGVWVFCFICEALDGFRASRTLVAETGRVLRLIGRAVGHAVRWYS